MQTIIGSTGEIGKRLAKLLHNDNEKIRLVSRNPFKINDSDELYKANVLNRQEISEAIKGSDTAYLLVGIQYKASVWEKEWLQIINNVITACKTHNTKLVFLDNVYMYGKVDERMNEETPYKPLSRKGKVRAEVADILMKEVGKGNIKAIIARSADFYGPRSLNTFIHPMVFTKLKNGKKANWIGNAKVKHSFTYTPDIAKALSVLGNSEEACNQIWHLPTDGNALTGEEIIKITAEYFNTVPKYSVISKTMMRIAGLFSSVARESVEMMYQCEHDYLFDSTKFENKFFKPTLYREGLKDIAGYLK
ncbi:MAG: NAD-dependent epimerase/dehydratase family protein [Ignavibacteria bacterium]|nr:NAD-dependent epimerase/dehydratase family protein [Ignavibacteria bacterium]